MPDKRFDHDGDVSGTPAIYMDGRLYYKPGTAPKPTDPLAGAQVFGPGKPQPPDSVFPRHEPTEDEFWASPEAHEISTQHIKE